MTERNKEVQPITLNKNIGHIVLILNEIILNKQLGNSIDMSFEMP